MCQAVSGIGPVIINWRYLDPVYMGKSCSWKDGHPPSQANFSERLHEKKLTPCASQELAILLAHALCMGDTAKRMTHLTEPTFS